MGNKIVVDPIGMAPGVYKYIKNKLVRLPSEHSIPKNEMINEQKQDNKKYQYLI